MKYYKKITLKDGRECILRNGTEIDAEGVLNVFIMTHEQTDYLLSYPDEVKFTVDDEAEYLKSKTESSDEIEIIAEVDGKIVGSAGIEAIDRHWKTRHRADFGISIDKEFWGLGIGRALTKACIECAKKAGYEQLELQVVAENPRATNMYLSEKFVEYGRNPRGFKSRMTGWQEVVLMKREL